MTNAAELTAGETTGNGANFWIDVRYFLCEIRSHDYVPEATAGTTFSVVWSTESTVLPTVVPTMAFTVLSTEPVIPLRSWRLAAIKPVS